jgi:hypothetical protein
MEKEMPTLEVVVNSLKKAKNEDNREFTKVDGQVEDHIMLVTNGEEKLLILQTTFDTHNTKVQGLCFENILTKDVIGYVLVELESLQRKVDSQTRLVTKHSSYC